jgi:DNA mismatch repair protein MSH6
METPGQQRATQMESPLTMPATLRTPSTQLDSNLKSIYSTGFDQASTTESTDEYSADFTYPFLKGVDTVSPRRPASITIPRQVLEKMNNMERQYWEIKSKHFNCVIFFKKGKFYELYDCDAVIGSREFGLKLTHDSTNRGKMRMSGVPEQSFAQWARLFVFRGHKVGRVEQMSPDDAEEGAGGAKAKCVPRELVQILTPATVTEASMLSSPLPAYLAAICPFGARNLTSFVEALALDASRRELLHCVCESPAELATLLNHLQPKELVIPGTDLLTHKSAQLVESLTELGKHMKYAEAQWESSVEVIDKERWIASCREVRGSNAATVIPAESDLSAEFLMANYLRSLKIADLYDVTAKGSGSGDDAVLTRRDYTAHRLTGGSQPTPMAIDSTGVSLSELQWERRTPDTGLILDASTIENLEVLANLYDGTSANSMYQHLCLCRSPGGKRLFREWLLRPISDPRVIRARQAAVFDGLIGQGILTDVEDFFALENRFGRKRSRDAESDDLPFSSLANVDLERALSRLADVAAFSSRIAFADPLVHYNTNLDLILNAISGLQTVLELGRRLKGRCGQGAPALLQELTQRLLSVESSLSRILALFDLRDATKNRLVIPAKGTFQEYDEAIETKNKCEATLQGKLLQYRAHYASSAINFADVGKDLFLVEMPIEKIKVAPPKGSNFSERARTTKTVKYTVGELQDLVEKYKAAETTRAQALSAVLRRIAGAFGAEHVTLFQAAQAVSYLDCLSSLALFSQNAGVASGPTCRPTLDSTTEPVTTASISAKEIWHPFVRSTERARNPVPNSIDLGKDNGRCLLLTGPNMGGKSTLMRTLALGVIMAQMGGCVCAESFTWVPLNRIFTRIGARDCVHRGHSTLFVELSETSDILRFSNGRSLCLLDELGRGTSTHDGYAIASATLHDLCNNKIDRPIPPLSIFSTHYHALAMEIEQECEDQRQFHSGTDSIQLGYMDFETVSRHEDHTAATTAVSRLEAEQAGSANQQPSQRWVHDIVFKYRLVEGICDRSFGCEVALKAGLPQDLVKEALKHSAWLSSFTETHRNAKVILDFLQSKKVGK